MAYDLALEFVLSAPPKRVMQLFTDPVLIRRWSGGEAELEGREGGRFMMFDGWASGEVRKATDDELAYSWKTEDWPEHGTASEVHYKLEKTMGGTKVKLRHTGFPDEETMKSHQAGWNDYFFDPLEDYIMVFEQ